MYFLGGIGEECMECLGGGGNYVFYYNKSQIINSLSHLPIIITLFFLTERSMSTSRCRCFGLGQSIMRRPRRVVSSSTITTTTRHNNTRGVHVGRTQQYTLHEVEYESLLLMAKSTYTWHKIVILFRRLWLSRV